MAEPSALRRACAKRRNNRRPRACRITRFAPLPSASASSRASRSTPLWREQRVAVGARQSRLSHDNSPAFERDRERRPHPDTPPTGARARAGGSAICAGCSRRRRLRWRHEALRPVEEERARAAELLERVGDRAHPERCGRRSRERPHLLQRDAPLPRPRGRLQALHLAARGRGRGLARVHPPHARLRALLHGALRQGDPSPAHRRARPGRLPARLRAARRDRGTGGQHRLGGARGGGRRGGRRRSGRGRGRGERGRRRAGHRARRRRRRWLLQQSVRRRLGQLRRLRAAEAGTPAAAARAAAAGAAAAEAAASP